MQSFSQPQEIEVWYIIPKIRCEIAKELSRINVAQSKISEILGVTKSAVSQYINGRRAINIDFPENIMRIIKESAKSLRQDPKKITTEVQTIIQEIRSSGLLCKYHKKYSKTEADCTICVS